jgi:IS605 OrfB family transposase
MQKEECYQELPRKISQQTLMMLDRNWRSFFNANKEFKKNPNKFQAMPRPPRYLHKQNGRFPLIYTKQAINKGNKLSGTNITINTNKDYKEIRVVCKKFGFIIEVIYEKEEKKCKNNENHAHIDIGLNNLVTITSNLNSPILVNGRIAKSFNQYANKLLSRAKSDKKIKQILKKRYFRIENYFHKVSNFIVNYLLKNNISKLVIGYNELWKQKIKSRNNQNFQYLPFLNLINKICYKCELAGINVIMTEESYTSKASFLDNDPLDGSLLSGKRLKRGLYKSKDGTLINADVNGSFNIGRKVFNFTVDRSLVARPLKVMPL